MYNKQLNMYVAVVSHNRACNVTTMHKHIGPCTWHVHSGEAKSYKDAGAQYIVDNSDSLVSNRNSVLECAFKKDLPCIMIDDDLQYILRCVWRCNKVETITMDFASLAEYLLRCIGKTKYKLAGCSPVCNSFYFNPKKPFSYTNFIAAACMLVIPCKLNFDPCLKMKEDYDFVVQHIMKYGGALRANMLMPKFLYRTNPGGMQDIRTNEGMIEANTYLMKKWPGLFKNNKRRENEILMRIPLQSKSDK